MLFIFSILQKIRPLWHLVFFHRCLTGAHLFQCLTEEVSHKQSARWQHLSQLNSSAFLCLPKNIQLLRNTTTYTWDWYRHLVGDGVLLQFWWENKLRHGRHLLSISPSSVSFPFNYPGNGLFSSDTRTDTNRIKLPRPRDYDPA